MASSDAGYPSCASCSPATRHASNPSDDDDDPNVQQLNHCAPLYLGLQDCLIKTNRNWRECQSEVKALRACFEASNQQPVRGDEKTQQGGPTKA